MLFHRQITPAACIKYDDSDLYSKYNDLDNRLSKLETLCQTINKDIASLRIIITALEQNDGIVSVEELYENESVVGYLIRLKSGGSFTIYNGKPGSPGKDADPTPTIGIRQDTDGLWYWTLDGTWLTDDSGNRIIASGQNGKDGITPKFRIVEGYWQISYDSGDSWTTIGKARGEDGQSVFAGINTDSQDYVVIKMTDNTSITLPRYKAISLKINGTEGITVSPGNTREITYAIEGASEDVQIETIAEGVKATVVKTDAFSGKIKVSIGETLEEGAKVLVFVVDKGQTVMRKLSFENSIITVTENTASGISYAGGIYNIDLMTNADIEILIPSEASSWISLPSTTKSIEHIQRSVVVAPNEGLSRSVTITIKDRFNPVSKDITIFQSEHPDFYESTDYSMNGTWKKLQTAKTDGNGLNIVFLGDAYTDTMIEDGRYDSDMQRAMEHFFEVEPYASMRDMFNCYQVYAVSKNNNYKEGSSTAFRCQFGSGTNITGYADKVRMYAQKVSEIKNGKPDSSWYTFIDDELYTHYSDIPGGMLCQ